MAKEEGKQNKSEERKPSHSAARRGEIRFENVSGGDKTRQENFISHREWSWKSEACNSNYQNRAIFHSTLAESVNKAGGFARIIGSQATGEVRKSGNFYVLCIRILRFGSFNRRRRVLSSSQGEMNIYECEKKVFFWLMLAGWLVALTL